MADLEKVIKGLACCTTIGEDGFPICDECPYFCDESCPNLDEMHKDALELLKAQQPTVDAVPVVRCKDCKHYLTEDVECPCNIGLADASPDAQYTWTPEPDWFCADGERK